MVVSSMTAILARDSQLWIWIYAGVFGCNLVPHRQFWWWINWLRNSREIPWFSSPRSRNSVTICWKSWVKSVSKTVWAWVETNCLIAVCAWRSWVWWVALARSSSWRWDWMAVAAVSSSRYWWTSRSICWKLAISMTISASRSWMRSISCWHCCWDLSKSLVVVSPIWASSAARVFLASPRCEIDRFRTSTPSKILVASAISSRLSWRTICSIRSPSKKKYWCRLAGRILAMISSGGCWGWIHFPSASPIYR